MSTYISLLRGINVSSQRIIKMDALREAYEELGFTKVKTYIQSGNVIFEDKAFKKEELSTIISGQLKKKFGFEVPVLVLTIAELKYVVENNPYVNDQEKNVSFMHVTFLSAGAENTNREKIAGKKLPGEEFEIGETVVYLYCPNGYGKTKLTNTFFETLFKVGATTRNWRTINELLRLSQLANN